MAKQHDEHDRPHRDDANQPAKKKRTDMDREDLEADDLEVVDELEPIEEIESVEELEMADESPDKPRKAPPTKIAGKPGQPTMIAKGDAAPQEPEELEELEEIPPTPKPPKPGAAPPPRAARGEPTPAEEEILDFSDVEEESGLAPPPKTPKVKGPSPSDQETPEHAAKDVFDVTEAINESKKERDLLRAEGKSSGVSLDKDEGAGTHKPGSKDEYANVGELDLVGEDDSGTVPLGKMESRGERPSGVDEIAEALESGLDLGKDDPKTVKKRTGLKPPGDTGDAAAADSASLKLGEKSAVRKADETLDAGAFDSDIFGDSANDRKALKEEAAEKAAEKAAERAAEKGAEKATDKAADKVTKTDKATKALKEPDIEDLAAEELEEEPAKPADKPAAKKGQAEAKAEEEEPPVKKPVRRAKPKRLRYVVGGFLLALLLLAGGAAAVWFFMPDTVQQIMGMIPKSPNAKHELAVMPKPEVDNLKNQVMALQADAGKLPELQKTIEQGKEAETKLKAQVASLQEKASSVPQLTKQRDQLDAALKRANKLWQGAVATLASANYIPDTDPSKFDLAAFQKVVKTFAASKGNVAVFANKLKDAQTALEKVKGHLSNIDEALAKAKVDKGAKGVEELIAARGKLEGERKTLNDAIQGAFKELVEAGLAPKGSDPLKQLSAAAKMAGQKAQSPLIIPLGRVVSAMSNVSAGAVGALQRGFDTAALQTELAFYRMREPLIEGPDRKLDTWLALLQDRNYKDANELANAAREAEWFRSPEAKAGPEARVKALLVTGLALRNQQKYAEAKTALDEAVKESADVKTPSRWSKLAASALAELTDSRAYYVPRIEKLTAASDWKGALSELDSALKILPNDGRLLAQRAVLRLEAGGAKLTEADQKLIRADAEAALKNENGAAEGAFALGQLEEATGNVAKAEEMYRQALKMPKATPEEQSRYRVALARILLRERAAAPPTPPASEPEKKGKGLDTDEEKNDEVRNDEVRALDPQAAATVVLLLTGVQAGVPDDGVETPAQAARIRESIKLAQELLKSPNPKDRAQGHMILGQALAKQGQRTEGLHEFVKGLDILFPGSTTKELATMIKEHPAFMQPTAGARPNPFLAEQHYGKGLHAYWSKKYDEAEKQFEKAIGYFKEDARYWYWLGLSRMTQPGNVKRDAAYFALEEGARMESVGHPGASEVNSAFERVQGNVRALLDEYRKKAVDSSK